MGGGGDSSILNVFAQSWERQGVDRIGDFPANLLPKVRAPVGFPVGQSWERAHTVGSVMENKVLCPKGRAWPSPWYREFVLVVT